MLMFVHRFMWLSTLVKEISFLPLTRINVETHGVQGVGNKILDCLSVDGTTRSLQQHPKKRELHTGSSDWTRLVLNREREDKAEREMWAGWGRWKMSVKARCDQNTLPSIECSKNREKCHSKVTCNHIVL